MKIYEANNELAEILLSQGFIDTTSPVDKIKKKKSFKLAKKSRKEIYFDYINIQIYNSACGQDSRIHLTETELKLLLLYFKLSPNDFKELDINGNFEFKNAETRLDYLKKEFEDLKQYDFQKRRKEKLMRIFNTFENISLKN